VDKTVRSVQPFRFRGLPQWTREQVSLQQSLAVNFSDALVAPDFGQRLAESLQPYLKAACNFSLGEYSILRPSQVHRLLPELSCLIVLGVTPTDHKIIVDLDLTLASIWIDRLLGGEGDAGRIRRPMTEIEQGVLSFPLLKMLSLLHDGWLGGNELGLCLERFASRPADVEPLLQGAAHHAVLACRIATGAHVGYSRVFVPQPLLQAHFGEVLEQANVSAATLAAMRQRFSHIGEVEVQMRVEGARLELSQAEVAELEPGDIVLLEEHALALCEDGVTGEVRGCIGGGRHGWLQGRLLIEGDFAKLEILQIVGQEQPAEVEMNESRSGPPPPPIDKEGSRMAPMPGEASEHTTVDNLPETEALLRDVDAPVVVELGRIRLNTSQVIRLRAGQILRLPRGPNDPVNLVVNGKLFARGELIEVDGELGVRLVQVRGN
jgi:flagellar motor switch protein FliM